MDSALEHLYSSTDTLISDFCPPEPRERNFCCSSHQVCGHLHGSHRELTPLALNLSQVLVVYCTTLSDLTSMCSNCCKGHNGLPPKKDHSTKPSSLAVPRHSPHRHFTCQTLAPFYFSVFPCNALHVNIFPIS